MSDATLSVARSAVVWMKRSLTEMPPDVSLSRANATREPSPLSFASRVLESPSVIWVKVCARVSKRKTSRLCSAFAPVRSRSEVKATSRPSSEMEG